MLGYTMLRSTMLEKGLENAILKNQSANNWVFDFMCYLFDYLFNNPMIF